MSADYSQSNAIACIHPIKRPGLERNQSNNTPMSTLTLSTYVYVAQWDPDYESTKYHMTELETPFTSISNKQFASPHGMISGNKTFRSNSL